MKPVTKQLSRFIIAGCSAVVTDCGVYFMLLQVMSPNISKTISFLSGTIVAYIINKYWTFEQPKKSGAEASKFWVFYLMTLAINVETNKLVLSITNQSVIWAFIIATGTSTVLNFIGQKWWVFKQQSIK